MLENEDIQHILLTRTPALTGRYEFLSFRNAAGGRAWLSAIREKAQSAAEVMASVEKDKRWVTVAFTWNGLRALGVDEGSLATFPEEFKQGMVARAEMLGDTGENHPPTGLEASPARSFTPSPSCSPATPLSAAFTWNGLRALGVDEASLATFPEEFKQGMVARAEMLGDTGENHPDHWVGGLASPDLHAIVILFARDEAERERCLTEHDKLVARCEGR